MNDAWRIGLVIGVYALDALIIVFVLYLATEIIGWVRRWWF